MHEAVKFVKRQDLMRLLLAGFNLRESAKQLDEPYQTVRRCAGHESFLSELKALNTEVYAKVDIELRAMRENLREKVEQASEQALDKLIHLMTNGKKEETQLKASLEILDRDGLLAKITKSEVKTSERNPLTPDLLLDVVKAAREVDNFYARQKSDAPQTTPQATPQGEAPA